MIRATGAQYYGVVTYGKGKIYPVLDVIYRVLQDRGIFGSTDKSIRIKYG